MVLPHLFRAVPVPAWFAQTALGLTLIGAMPAGCAKEPPAGSLSADPLPEGPARVELRRNPAGAWRFFVNGGEFPIRGAGGAEAPGLLEELKAAGGNCVRTWGLETLEKPVAEGERFMDRAWRLGLMVVPGIWLEHERHGFDYADPDFIRQQRERVLAGVRRWKDHPAILAWGLGNEMEGPASSTGSVAVFQEVEELAKLIQEEDVNHPVMSVIAFTPAKIPHVLRHCPSIEVLGLNAYGGAAGAGEALQAAGWTKPFAITEFGGRGFWEVPATAWGAPLEPTSQEKARTYYAVHRLIMDLNDGKELCVGTFAFLWGWKQERTATWFGMFLPTGEKLPPVDAMTRAWTHQWPGNRCPRIARLESAAAGQTVPPDQKLSATVTVIDPDGDPLSFDWSVVAESAAASEGGDAEEAATTLAGLIDPNGTATCGFRSPSAPGAYRLGLIVRDGRGAAATANFPFRVAD